jgi:hypothetical protein
MLRLPGPLTVTLANLAFSGDVLAIVAGVKLVAISMQSSIQTSIVFVMWMKV